MKQKLKKFLNSTTFTLIFQVALVFLIIGGLNHREITRLKEVNHRLDSLNFQLMLAVPYNDTLDSEFKTGHIFDLNNLITIGDGDNKVPGINDNLLIGYRQKGNPLVTAFNISHSSFYKKKEFIHIYNDSLHFYITVQQFDHEDKNYGRYTDFINVDNPEAYDGWFNDLFQTIKTE